MQTEHSWFKTNLPCKYDDSIAFCGLQPVQQSVEAFWQGYLFLFVILIRLVSN